MHALTIRIKQNQDENSVRLHLLFLVILAITILSAVALALLYKLFTHASHLDASMIIPRYQPGLIPKPRERFVFLILAFTIPISSFIAAGIFFKGYGQLFIATKDRLNYLILTSVAILYLPFVRFDFSQELIHTGVRLPTEHPIFTLAMTLVVSSFWYFFRWTQGVHSFKARSNHLNTAVAWTVLLMAIFLQMSGWRIFSELSITQLSVWHVSADAVFYAIGQVAAGKTLLVDLPSQYGLYPELLAPIFKWIGLSVFHFTALCAVLQVVSLASVYWVISRVVRDGAIKLAFAIALVMVTFETIMLQINIPEPYFQYWPIRFFWPAISVLAFYRYSNQPTLWRVFQVSLVGAVGALWNMDSGLMIVIAFAGVLIAKWFVLRVAANQQADESKQRHFIYALFVHLGTFVIVVSLMFIYLYWKAGAPIHWNWLFEYQKIFYGLGFGMLPMPLHPYPWMSILSVYLMALLVSAKSWATHPHAKNADLPLFISLLGLGLFLYYESRSHPLNLITVCWPALMLIAILADRVLRAVRAHIIRWQHIIYPIAALSVLLFCSIPFVRFTDKFLQNTVTQFENRKIPADPLVSDELHFIRQHSKPGDECVILSLRQGLYYAATGLVSPISGPGYVEMILQKDHDTFLNQLTQRRFECIFVGVGNSSKLDLGIDPIKALKNYRIVAQNAHQSMLFLQPQHIRP